MTGGGKDEESLEVADFRDDFRLEEDLTDLKGPILTGWRNKEIEIRVECCASGIFGGGRFSGSFAELRDINSY